MNIKIAIIDVGINKEISENSVCNVEHFSIVDGSMVKKYKAPLENHGTYCFKEILKQNIGFDVLDINVTDNNILQINNIILGIKKAIEQRVDIINISLGFTEYTECLFNVCQEALENNIIIISAASHTSEISYPSSLKNVVSVEINQNQKNEIERVDDSTVSLKIEDKIVYENGVSFNFASTSLASAYFSGLFAKQLSKNPVFDKCTILRNLYNLEIFKDIDYIDQLVYKKMELYKRIKNKRIAVVLLPFSNDNIINCDLKLKNIVAYYNIKEKKFCCLHTNKETLKFDTILVINSSQFKVEISDFLKSTFTNYEMIFVGEFKNADIKNDLVYSYENFNIKNLSTLQKPLILISGIYWDLGKFEIQEQLIQNFKNDGFSIKSVTYNSKGVIYGFDVFEYPEKIIFPDIVSSVNNYMCCAENSEDFDAWVINVGGGMFVNNFNKFSFGKLTEAYFHATNVDMLILCLPTFVSLEQFKFNIMKAETYGIKKVLFVISQNTCEGSTLNSYESMKTYKVDKEKYQNYINYLKNNSNKNVFSLDDVKTGKLYNEILKNLS